MNTSEALKKLANQEARQVCLTHDDRFSAIVTFDRDKEELVFRLIGSHPLSMRTLLFQTEPAWVL